MMAIKRQAKFVTGSTMRHVIVMTSTGMIGLSFMFLVDAITLFWVSKLENEILMAAMGYAWTIQFFTISICIAFIIGATAIVSKSLGKGNYKVARKQTTVSAMWSFIILVVFAIFLITYRFELLEYAGAKGEALDVAARFLKIVIPSIPIMGLGMIGSAILRAEGDGFRSMMVTVSSGCVAVVVDPLLIFGFNLGIEGAAFGICVARLCSTIIALYFVIKVKDLAAKVSYKDMKLYAGAFFAIVIPSILTQLATPTGNFLATRVISDFGEAAMAGWTVLGRIVLLAFGGVFALSSAIGGIVGQNYGARKFDRVRTAYRDSLIFCTVYVCFTWVILALCANTIISIFGLSPEAGEIIKAFNYFSAGSFIFAGALYVSNACFNNLGKPLYSTISNWIKNGILMFPLCILGGQYMGAVGVVYGQSLAFVLAGVVAVTLGWRFITQVEMKSKIQ